jgi:hypothetical protein
MIIVILVRHVFIHMRYTRVLTLFIVSGLPGTRGVGTIEYLLQLRVVMSLLNPRRLLSLTCNQTIRGGE